MSTTNILNGLKRCREKTETDRENRESDSDNDSSGPAGLVSRPLPLSEYTTQDSWNGEQRSVCACISPLSL